MKIFNILFLCLVAKASIAQTKKGKTLKVLFIGNSYVYVNSLPSLCTKVAASAGDNLICDSSTEGGYTLEMHSNYDSSINKIKKGHWDYVVLQEQSQLPSEPINQVAKSCFPFAHILDSIVHKYTSTAKTVFYMSWGRKNGDSSRCTKWPAVCTYQGMDSLIYERYMMMAEQNNSTVSPVGAVWKMIRKQYPTIDLYNADGSHPSEAGSYLAACCFYTVFLGKDPSLIKFNYTLNNLDATRIRNAVKKIVFEELSKWHISVR